MSLILGKAKDTLEPRASTSVAFSRSPGFTGAIGGEYTVSLQKAEGPLAALRALSGKERLRMSLLIRGGRYSVEEHVIPLLSLHNV